jgi:hypothetical protein
MQYVLGNMLNGGGINPDGLSLDLQFAADKTLTARRGPTPAFTRGSTGTFVGSDGLIQSAAINTPRFDHDPTSPFACRGLLIEEGRTNLLWRSEEFGDAYWEKVRATISADQTASPTGQTTADKLINDTTASNNHRVDRGSLSLNLNTVYTVSVFAKASEYSGLALGVDPSTPTTSVQFSLSGSGSVTAQNAGYTGTIQNFGNGWFRCTATFTSSSTVPTHRLYIYVGQNGTTFSYTGDGTSGIFIWGAQLETGSFATSYIPTTTGTLARGADVCNITGSNFNNFYNQSEGAFLLKATSLMATATGGNRTFVSFTDGGYINQQALYKTVNGTNLNFAIGSGVGPTIGTLTAGSPFAVSGAMQVANNAAAFNGAAAVAVTGSATTGISKLEFRDPTGAAAGHPTMHISQFRYYKKRLPNAKLQALTV